MKIVNLSDVPKRHVDMEGAAQTSKQLVIGSRDGSPNFSFRVFTVAPGGHTPYHTHATEHINYVISGSGALVDANGAEHPLRQGDFALVLPEEKHQYRNASPDADLVMICAVPKEYE
jgi:quercetin dioxygenase-like cupin family protein